MRLEHWVQLPPLLCGPPPLKKNRLPDHLPQISGVSIVMEVAVATSQAKGHTWDSAPLKRTTKKGTESRPWFPRRTEHERLWLRAEKGHQRKRGYHDLSFRNHIPYAHSYLYI